MLSVARTLDYETTSGYRLNISATDGQLTSTALLSVNVTNVADGAPRFDRTEYIVFLSEDDPPGTFVLRVNASGTPEHSQRKT